MQDKYLSTLMNDVVVVTLHLLQFNFIFYISTIRRTIMTLSVFTIFCLCFEK